MRDMRRRRNLVWVLECPAVNAVVRGVETALWEPDYVACCKATRSNGLERTIPMKGFARHLRLKKRGGGGASHDRQYYGKNAFCTEAAAYLGPPLVRVGAYGFGMG